jgi:phage-related protein (TIGR01555 family)
MPKTSVRALVRDAKAADKRARTALVPQGSPKALLSAATGDSFVNFAHKLGVGADNPLTSATYGYNPITRNRQLLEWIHRGSWLGGVSVDLIADDMTRAGVDFVNEMTPDDSEAMSSEATNLGIWDKTNEVIQWGRLYGGCIGVLLIDGQDMKTPLKLDTVGRNQFKGIMPLDRWQIEPSLEDLVTEYGPHLGLPKYYTVMASAPALRGVVIHHSRVAFRVEGIRLSYQQRLTENLWGISVLERLYDRMLGFDSATTGAAQLVYKAYLRTLKIKGMREIAATGGAPLTGLMQYTEIMRRFQGMEGITLIDGEDEFEVQEHAAFSGLSDALNQLGQQLSGALQIPLVRLFGQSPAGLNSSGDSDLRTYYDNIRQRQQKELFVGMTMIYKLIAQSQGITLPKNFAINFTSLWQLDDTQKAEVASKVQTTVSGAFNDALIGRQTALRELRQQSKITGIFTNITQEIIEAADDEVLPPMGGEGFGEDPPPLPGSGGQQESEDPSETLPGDEDGKTGQGGQARPVAGGASRRVKLQH